MGLFAPIVLGPAVSLKVIGKPPGIIGPCRTDVQINLNLLLIIDQLMFLVCSALPRCNTPTRVIINIMSIKRITTELKVFEVCLGVKLSDQNRLTQVFIKRKHMLVCD